MKKIILLLVVSLSMAACTDLLDINPVSINSGDSFWDEGEVSVKKSLAGIYSKLRNPFASGKWFVYGDLPSQLSLGYNSQTWWGYFPVTEIDNANGRTFNHERLEDFRDWSQFYTVISSANIMIAHTEEMALGEFGTNETEATKVKNQYLGEAYFLRAFTYFYMVRIWGDVPYYREAIESSSALVTPTGETVNLACSPEIDVLHSIQEDLEIAISYMDYDQVGSNSWAIHANKATAYALKAHVNTWLANRDQANETTLLNEAISSIESVETNGGYTLVDYDDPDAMRNMFLGRSSETIFEIHFSTEDNESFPLKDRWGGLNRISLIAITPDKTNYNSVFQMYNEEKQSLFNMDDKRKAFYTNWERGNPWADMNRPGDDRSQWIGTTLAKFENYTHDDMADQYEEDEYFIESSIPIFRLSGLKLLKAEILAKVGRYGDARTVLNASRNRCGIGDFAGTDDELIVEVIKERARELAGEGHSYYDRIRNNYFSGCSSIDAERIAGKGYYWPFAYKLTLNNELLVQQPYWKGKVPELN